MQSSASSQSASTDADGMRFSWFKPYLIEKGKKTCYEFIFLTVKRPFHVLFRSLAVDEFDSPEDESSQSMSSREHVEAEISAE